LEIGFIVVTTQIKQRVIYLLQSQLF